MIDDISQTPFEFGPTDDAEFAENAEPRCPCVLLLDTSTSMAGEPIRQLNEGLKILKEELAADSLAGKRVEIAVMTFGPTRLECDFSAAQDFEPPELTANGDTPLGEAIEAAIDLVTKRKEVVRQHLGQSMCLRPWIWLITDGGPTDGTRWKAAAKRVHEGDNESAKSFSLFCVGVRGANMEILAQIATRPPVPLDGLRFRDMFVWLSSSLSGVAKSQPGTQITLRPLDWTSISS